MEAEDDHGPGCMCSGYKVTDKDDCLFNVIDKDKIYCLNEAVPKSCRNVFRPFAERSQFEKPYLSPPEDDDHEIILVVPFTEEVKVRAITIVCGDSPKPQTVGLWSNKENFDFSLVEDEQPVNLLQFGNWTTCGGEEVNTK